MAKRTPKDTIVKVFKMTEAGVNPKLIAEFTGINENTVRNYLAIYGYVKSRAAVPYGYRGYSNVVGAAADMLGIPFSEVRFQYPDEEPTVPDQIQIVETMPNDTVALLTKILEALDVISAQLSALEK